MAKPTITWQQGFYDDCSDASLWSEGETGLSATLTSDGDVFTITGTGDNAPANDEYVVYERNVTDFSTTVYTKCLVRWKTSVASNGLQAEIKFIDSGAATFDATVLGFSTTWVTTTINLTAGKTLDKIQILANDNPDSWTGTAYVYFDFIMFCKGVFPFPHVAPGGIRVDLPMKLAELEIPGRGGDIIQRLGMKSPEITLTGEILKGETWESSASVPHFDYLLIGLRKDAWAWFTCDHPRIKCKVIYKHFTFNAESTNSDAELSWQLTLKVYSLSNLEDANWDDWQWLYQAT